ncbi:MULTISPECIES: hypothetical protein [unclassified Myxococcus]|nr:MULTISPECIES: hypothetical protein [unclassified Myxococcus]
MERLASNSAELHTVADTGFPAWSWSWSAERPTVHAVRGTL